MRQTAEQRFWSRINKDGPVPQHWQDLGPCWLWLGHKSKDGYGKIRVGGRKEMYVHAFSWVLAGLTIPEDGLVFDHLCRNRGCANWNHLQRVTNRINVLRGDGLTAKESVQTHCKHGHELTDENVYRHPSRPNGRICIRCKSESNSKRRR